MQFIYTGACVCVHTHMHTPHTVVHKTTAQSAAPAGDYLFQETGPWWLGRPPCQVRLPGACFRISKADGFKTFECMCVTL